MTNQSWTTIDAPSVSWTEVLGIDGSNLVGMYNDGSVFHGFEYTIPEPATLLLFSLGVLIVRRKERAKLGLRDAFNDIFGSENKNKK
jgi:hypothetical protein